MYGTLSSGLICFMICLYWVKKNHLSLLETRRQDKVLKHGIIWSVQHLQTQEEATRRGRAKPKRLETWWRGHGEMVGIIGGTVQLGTGGHLAMAMVCRYEGGHRI